MSMIAAPAPADPKAAADALLSEVQAYDKDDLGIDSSGVTPAFTTGCSVNKNNNSTTLSATGDGGAR